MFKLLEYIGRKVINLFLYFVDLFVLAKRLLFILFDYKLYKKKMIRQYAENLIYYITIKSVVTVILIALVFGAFPIFYFEKVIANNDFTNLYISILLREVSPLIIIFILIIKLVIGISVEVSHMNVSKELEAFEMSGIDPLKILCLPFLTTTVFSMLSLMLIFNITSIIGGYMISLMFSNSYFIFFIKNIIQYIKLEDVVIFFIKGFVFSFIISTIAIYHGLEDKNIVLSYSTEHIVKATLNSFLICLFFNILISFLFLAV